MKVKLLDQTHRDYDGTQLAQLDALFEGGTKWRALLDTWLPKLAREPDDSWQERKALATYTNEAGPIVSMLSALLFSESPEVEAPGEFWPVFAADCDRHGTTLAAFLQVMLDAAQVGGRAYAWVNLPQQEGPTPATLAEQDGAGLRRAFVVPLTATQVRNWGRDELGLAWLLARGLVEEQAGPTEPISRRIRWTAITRTTIIQWEWTPTEEQREPGPDSEAVEVRRVEHGAGMLPVVDLVLPPGLWTMGKLADVALRATRAENDLGWALHQAANELLVIKSKAKGEITLGHGAYLVLGQDDDASFVAPTGVAFEHLERREESSRQALYRVVHQMAVAADPGASADKASGESKAMDWQALGVILSAYQALVLAATKRVVEVAAALRGETAEVAVTGLEGWRTEDLGTWLEQVIMAPDAARMSPTYRKEVAKHQARRLLGQAVAPGVLDQVLAEIDKAAVEDPAAYPVGPGKEVQEPPPKDDDDDGDGADQG